MSRPNRGTGRNQPVGFLFINKDQKSKSLSKSDGVDAARINSHAQQVRNRWRDAEKLSSAKGSSVAARRVVGGWQKPTSLTSSLESSLSPETPSSPPISSEGQQSNHEEDLYATTGDLGHLAGAKGVAVISTTTKLPPSLRQRRVETLEPRQVVTFQHDQLHLGALRSNTLRQNSVEPFNVFPGRITSQVKAVLSWGMKIYQYSTSNSKMAFLPPHLHRVQPSSPVSPMVRSVFAGQCHYYAMLTTVTTHMKRLYGMEVEGLSPEVLKAKAIVALRAELVNTIESGDIDKQLMVDILYLALAEQLNGQLDAAIKHLEIVGKMLHLLNASQPFDQFVLETAGHVDNFIALSRGTPPILPAKLLDPGPMLPERMSSLKLEATSMQRYGRPFQVPAAPVFPNVARSGALGPENDAIYDLASTLDLRMATNLQSALEAGVFDRATGAVVLETIECVMVAKVVWFSPVAISYDADWLCRKARSVFRQLQKLTPDFDTDKNADLACSDCMEAMRLILLILWAFVVTLGHGQKAASFNGTRLCKAMTTAVPEWWHSVPAVLKVEGLIVESVHRHVAGLIFWGAVTGVYATAGLAESAWFCDTAAFLAPWLKIQTFEDIHDHMSCYLYSKTIEEHALREVAVRIERGGAILAT